MDRNKCDDDTGRCLLCLINIPRNQENKNKTRNNVMSLLYQLIQHPTFKSLTLHQINSNRDDKIKKDEEIAANFCPECILIIDETSTVHEQIVQLESKLRSKIILIRNKILGSDDGVLGKDSKLRKIRRSLLPMSDDVEDDVDEMIVKVEPLPPITENVDAKFYDNDDDDFEILEDPLEIDEDVEEGPCSPSDFFITPDQGTSLKQDKQEDFDYIMDNNGMDSDSGLKIVKQNKKRTTTPRRKRRTVKKEKNKKSTTKITTIEKTEVQGRTLRPRKKKNPPKKIRITEDSASSEDFENDDDDDDNFENDDDDDDNFENDDDDEDLKLKCPNANCDTTCTSERTLSIHISKTHGHHCTVCDHVSRRFEEKLKHEKSEHKGDPRIIPLYTCKICQPERSFVNNTKFEYHTFTRHEDKNNQPLSCSKCDKKFTLDYNLQRHLKFHKFEDEKPFVCQICDCRFAELERMERHAKAHYRCTTCEKTYTNKKQHERHMRLHTGQRPFKCDHGDCEESFIDEIRRTVHIDKCHTKDQEKEITCPKCPMKFSTLAVLRFHSKRHKTQHPVTCDECGEKFRIPAYLQTHKIKKHGADPFMCDECGETFTGYHKHRLHKIAHTGVKPFKCDVCSTSFAFKHVLEDHIRVHTGERPFVCDECGKAFARNTDMRTHKRRIHSKDFVMPTKYICIYCGKGFPRNDSMEGHIRQIHTGERPFICSLCNKGYAIKSALTGHMKSAHGIIKESTVQRLPRSKRDEFLPPSSSSSSNQTATTKTKPVKYSRTRTKNKKSRRKEISESETSSSMEFEDNSVDTPTNIHNLRTTTTPTTNTFPVPPFYNPALSQYYQF